MQLFSDYQLPIIACFLLFFAMFLYWISLSFPKNQLIFQVSKICVIGSNLLFMTTLLMRWITEGYFPLSNLYESLIFLSWGISFIHLVIEAKTKSSLIGAISTPLMFFLSGFSSLTLPTDMQKALPLVPSLQSNWLMMHVTMMMISYATLIVGSLLSLLYLAFLTFSTKETKKVNFELSNTPTTQETVLSQPVYSKLSLLQTVDLWSYRIIGLGVSIFNNWNHFRCSVGK